MVVILLQQKGAYDMRFNTMLACLALMLSGAADLLAQFTPVVAKIKAALYVKQPDGTEAQSQAKEGFYYRSSRGDSLKTVFYVSEAGEQLEPGRSNYVNASTGEVYFIDHHPQKATLMRKRELPLAPFRLPETIKIEGREVEREARVIAGVHCVAAPITTNRNGEEQIAGKIWWALGMGFPVKTEDTLGPNARAVWELYDIEFKEPEPSKFDVLRGFTIDRTECVNCDHQQ